MTIIIYAKQFIPSIHTKFSTNEMRRINLGLRLNGKIINKKNRLCHLPLFAKKSPSQDFQDFVKPSRLLQAEEPKIYSQNTPKETFYPSNLDQSEAFYLLELITSRDFGSGLSDLNSAIMICLIDSDGNSILQRVPPIPNSDPFGEEIGFGSVFDELVHFQRGSVDTVALKGTKLGKIVAVWIGLESGSWRLDGIKLTIINSISKNEAQSEDLNFNSFQFKFEQNTISLGEKDSSIVQFKPTHAIELQGNNLKSLFPTISPNSTQNIQQSKDESMREYSDLKFSLLVYDLALVFSGFTVLMLFSFEKESYSFLLGGFFGLVYLILLQRSVDGIPSPDLKTGGNKTRDFAGKPFLVLAFLVLGSGVVLKYGILKSGFEITASELFVGVAGFWASKVAVLLAAFRPIKRE
ncbi:hypothetical protein LUZ60_005824 [Juncus effusus]|nr:hypothetical protein LUZ60_005824 [Juncus effusus]